MEEDIKLRPIGIVEKAGEISEIRIFPEYHQGLTAIGDYQKLMVLFWMHIQDNARALAVLVVSTLLTIEPLYSLIFTLPETPELVQVTV